jgi:hypothetical protein
MALSLEGAENEAIAVERGVVAIAEATRNPHSISQAFLAAGLVHRYADPAAALAALRKALQIAQESGNRFDESHTAVVLSQLEVRHGAPQSALDHLALAIRNYQDSGNIATSRSPLAILAALLYRLRHYESRSHSPQSSPPTRWLTELPRRSAKPSPACERFSATTPTNHWRAGRIHDQRRHGYVRAGADRTRPRRSIAGGKSP